MDGMGWADEGRGFLFAAAADGRLTHISAEREQKRTGGFWMDMDGSGEGCQGACS